MKFWGSIAVSVLFFALVGIAPAFAQTPPPVCDTPAQKAQCQAQYDQLQQEIAQFQKVIDDTKNKEKSLQGDVTQLNAQISKAEAEIKQRNLVIGQLSDQISQKTAVVQSLQEQLQQGRNSLSKLIRQKEQAESQPLMILALSSGSLSDFFSEVQDIDSINQNLQVLFDTLQQTKTKTQKESDALTAQQNAQLDARHDAQLLQQVVSTAKKQKTDELTVTKGQESAYNQVLAQKQAEAQAIRNALFKLRDAGGISFSDALQYATVAEAKTGVRAAMILAILSQESDLGQNIGSCYVRDLDSGDGVGKSTGTYFQKVMKAPRDTDPFEQITSALGLEWSTAPVSCPLGATYTSSRGYGGAMGPSQFIPSTWQLFSPRISAALGISGQTNPWEPQQAIMATALYLGDLGAGGQTYSSERNAACKYYSGRACDARRPINYTYGDSVVAKAQTYQNNIDFLTSNNL